MYTFIAVGGVAVFVAAIAIAARRCKKPVLKYTGFGVAAATLAATVAVPTLDMTGDDDFGDDDPKPSAITLSVEDNTEVPLCFRGVQGTGRAPEGESLALLVRGLNDAQYYLAHHVPDEQEWRMPRFQVGAIDTAPGTPYELVVWKFDTESARVADHLAKAQFTSRPPGATEVARSKVIRMAATAKDQC
ncbi:hypothetical protein AB0D62_02965 [Streptomyces massasporeus]|uniref:hypothetical protein n=1 Tax=Streptomyces massasporeus TaxID=67324 RepID=UPI0033CCB445